MHRVVILGGGFGGLLAAQALRRAPVDITLVDRRNFHLFQPLLYQVATGSLSPSEVAAPLRSILRNQKNARVLMGEAVDLDPQARTVTLKCTDESVACAPANEKIIAVSYDTLIVSTGAQNFYFGNRQWQAVAPALKSVEDATAMRHKIL